MDDEMIERCVVAGVSASGFGKYDTKKIVLAVIKAMREPTINMMGLGIIEQSAEIWRSAIDSILNDR